MKNFIAVLLIAIIFYIGVQFPLSTIGALLAWQITMNIITDPLMYYETEVVERKIRAGRTVLEQSNPNHYQQIKSMFDAIERDEEMAIVEEDFSELIINPNEEEVGDDDINLLWFIQMDELRLENGYC